jgi:hypothetical protein
MGVADVAYIVRAVLTDSGVGTYTGELATRHAAIASAKDLRRHGLKTTVTIPMAGALTKQKIECGLQCV